MIASREKHLESLIEFRNLHIQARDASMKVVEANDKMLDLMQQMIAVMEKNAIYYGEKPC